MSVHLPGRMVLTLAVAVLGFLIMALGACGMAATPSPEAHTATIPAVVSQSIVIGSINPDEPAKKIEQLQPLANYLALRLAEFSIQDGRVIIARDIDDMASIVDEGRVDVILDASLPSLDICELSGCQFLLRQQHKRYCHQRKEYTEYQ